MGPLGLGARRGWAGHCPLSPEPPISRLYADHLKKRNDSSSGRNDGKSSLRRGRVGEDIIAGRQGHGGIHGDGRGGWREEGTSERGAGKSDVRDRNGAWEEAAGVERRVQTARRMAQGLNTGDISE